MISVGHSTEAEILERMIEPQSRVFHPALANYILSLKFVPKDQQRVDDLLAKAQQGALSGAEEHELDSYLNVGHFLALLHSKARISLKNGNGSA